MLLYVSRHSLALIAALLCLSFAVDIAHGHRKMRSRTDDAERPTCLTYLIGIGTQKGGTTSAWAYIRDKAHPMIQAYSKEKEIGFFTQPGLQGKQQTGVLVCGPVLHGKPPSPLQPRPLAPQEQQSSKHSLLPSCCWYRKYLGL
jgi:hypothetical protein